MYILYYYCNMYNLPPWHNKNNKNNKNKMNEGKKDKKLNNFLDLINEIENLEKKENKKVINFIDLLNEINKLEKKDNNIKKIHIAHVTPNMLLQPLLNSSFNQLKNKNKIIKKQKEIFKIDDNKIYDELNIKINSIQDLINLGEMYKENHNYPIDLKCINDCIPILKRLEKIIGMQNVKKNIIHQIIYFLSGLDINDDMLHTVITGPPGVGKTLLGNIIGELYYKLGIINGNGKKYIDPITNEEKDYIFKIAKRSDLIGEFLGHTAIKTQKIINECEGGVLFIDEAYSLGNNEKHDIYSKECIDTINQNLTEKKTKFVCIIAGYPEALEKCFFSVNDGLKRRFPFKYDIDKYTPFELTEILMLMIKNKNWKLDNNLLFNDIIKFIETNYNYFPNFGGDIETLFFNIRIAHSMRTIGILPSNKKYISLNDINEGFNLYKNNIKQENNKYLSFYI
jgi:SpoVK/Ycf46/Vps4 family AAA+-type ATPase